MNPKPTTKVEITTHFNDKQQAFLDFVLAHYVSEGVQELNQDKLTPLLRLKYNNSIADAIAEMFESEAYAAIIPARDKGFTEMNILVTKEGVPKLLDFGIAKLLEGDRADSKTRTGQLLLTPQYAAPEQLRGETVSIATDVYQLGAVAYFLLVGRPVFDQPLVEVLDIVVPLERRIEEVSTAVPDRRFRCGDIDFLVDLQAESIEIGCPHRCPAVQNGGLGVGEARVNIDAYAVFQHGVRGKHDIAVDLHNTGFSDVVAGIVQFAVVGQQIRRVEGPMGMDRDAAAGGQNLLGVCGLGIQYRRDDGSGDRAFSSS